MSHHAGRAFTVLELIVVVILAALLMALVVPQIHSVRKRSLDAASLANMRTHAQVLSLYSNDHRDTAPFLADPDATYTVARGGGLTVTYEFFEAVELWGVSLVDDYYGFGLGSDRWDEDIDWSVFARPGPGGLLYQYSPTSFTLPAYWDVDSRRSDQLRSIRVSQVRYPATKVVFMELDEDRGFPVWNGSSRSQDRKWAFGQFDGSVTRPNSNRFIEPCRIGEGLLRGGRFNYGVVGLHTNDGILGRDFQ